MQALGAFVAKLLGQKPKQSRKEQMQAERAKHKK
jgi:hypothetical protein